MRLSQRLMLLLFFLGSVSWANDYNEKLAPILDNDSISSIERAKNYQSFIFAPENLANSRKILLETYKTVLKKRDIELIWVWYISYGFSFCNVRDYNNASLIGYALLDKAKEAQNVKWETDAYFLLYQIDRDLKRYDECIETLNLRYEKAESINDLMCMSTTAYLTGYIYYTKRQNDSAAIHLEKAIEIDKKALVAQHHEYVYLLARVYLRNKADEKAIPILHQLTRSDSDSVSYNRHYGAGAKSYLSNIYTYMGIQDSADYYFNKASEEYLSHDSISYYWHILYKAVTESEMNQHQAALEKLDMVKEFPLYGNPPLALAQIYERAGIYEQAAIYYSRAISESDSLNLKQQNEIENVHEVILQNQLNAQKEIDAKKNFITAQQVKYQKRQKYQIIIFVSVVGVVIFLFIWMQIKRFKTIKSQRDEIERQKLFLEEKNKEILDSITYAKRIQTAILPSSSLLKETLHDSFVFYKPKDVVAGDFYWLIQKDGYILFAAADCTGHGVPGAMVSVVCNNALNRSVKEYGLTKPGDILDKTRNIVIQEFEASDLGVKDGMDIALCALKGNTLQYAGAHNPLWIVRDEELIEIKGDKQPIGEFYNPTDFKTHQIDLVENDQIYLFTDGFMDQFGGEKGKKLNISNFRKLLLSICHLSIAHQEQSLEKFFDEWKGDLDQLDDVCVIGFRV